MITSPTAGTASAAPCRGAGGQIGPANNGHSQPGTNDGQRQPVGLADDAKDAAALRLENANLRAQLASLPVIEQAKGILVACFQISPLAAFALLRRWSCHTNRKLRDISGLLVDAASHPDGQSRQPPTGQQDRPCADLEQFIDWLTGGRKPEQVSRVAVRTLEEEPRTDRSVSTIDAAITSGTDLQD